MPTTQTKGQKYMTSLPGFAQSVVLACFFLLLLRMYSIHHQKKGKRNIQERAAQATDETVGLMKLHRPPITEERRTQSVCVVEEGERTSNVSLTPDTILQNSDDFLSKNIPSSLKLNRRTFFVAENVLRFPNGGEYMDTMIF